LKTLELIDVLNKGSDRGLADLARLGDSGSDSDLNRVPVF